MSLVETIPQRRPATFFASEPKVELLRELKRAGYVFVTPSTSTHRRVLRRPQNAEARSLRDVFGWSLPFAPHVLSPRLLEVLTRGDLVRPAGDLLRSTVRVSTLGDDLLLHSAFPTNTPDAVFFGPDTYRFANFLREELSDGPSRGVVVDVGAGSGAGGIVAARCGVPNRLILADINPRALDLAAANLRAAGLAGETLVSNGLASFNGHADFIVANPPFIAGSGGLAYRDGGGLHGCRLSLEWAVAAVGKLNPGGRLLLYTGSAIVDGEDRFLAALEARIGRQAVQLSYRELDPDIFGGMLSSEPYADVERIAAVGLSVTRL
jgi:SAM-dependent methyltransferase